MQIQGDILIISGQGDTLFSIHDFFRSRQINIYSAESIQEVRLVLEAKKSIVATVVDLCRPPQHPENIVEELAIKSGFKPLIAIIPQSDIYTVIHAIKQGAHDYIMAPLDQSELLQALRNATHLSLRESLLNARRNGWDREGALLDFTPKSPVMRERMQKLAITARSATPLTLMTDPHSDVTDYARLVHFLSINRFEPFVHLDGQFMTINHIKSILPRQKLRDNTGIPDRGTLFFNNALSLPLACQHALLDYWDEQERLYYQPELRLVFGINQRLSERRHPRLDSEFADQILANVIEFPPLSSRPEDIIAMAYYWIEFYARKYNKEINELDESAKNALLSHSWPGDYWELANLVERGVLFCQTDTLRLEDLGDFKQKKNAIELVLPSLQLECAEQVLIDQALRGNDGNISRAASTLGVSRGTLYNKMKKYGLEYQKER
jgi:DNA-binding NtrC family response regulator